MRGIPERWRYVFSCDNPPHVEYSLTEMGRDLLPVFYAIMNWGFKYDKELYGDTKK